MSAIRCPQCGCSFDRATARVCPECGAAAPSSPRPRDRADQPRRAESSSGSNLLLWLGLGALVLVLFCCGGAAIVGVVAWRIAQNVQQNVAAMAAVSGKASAPARVRTNSLPTTSDEALSDLRSGESMRQSMAINYLAGHPPDPTLQNEIAQELAGIMTSAHLERHRAAEVLGDWATPKQVPALIEMAERRDPRIFQANVKAFLRLKDQRAIPVIGKGLLDLGTRGAATQALIAFGAAAEPETLKYVEHEDHAVRGTAHLVMHSIATPDGIAQLEMILARLEQEDKPESRITRLQLREMIPALKARKK